MPTLFTKIIEGAIPGTFVWRDELCVAFLSINPLGVGHTLVVPIAEYDHWIELPAELNQHLFAVSQVIGTAQTRAFACDRIGLIVAGYEIPHVHVHVIPTTSIGQFNFANQGDAAPAELEAAAVSLRAALRDMGRREVSDLPGRVTRRP